MNAGAEIPPGAVPQDPRDRTEVRQLTEKTAANLGGAAVTATASFLLVVAVTHELTRRSAGVLFAATSLFLLLEAAAGLGTGTGMVYFLPRLRRVGDVESIRRIVRSASAPVAVAALAAAVVLAMLPGTFGEVMTRASGSSSSLVLWALAFALPFAAIADLLQAATRGFERMRVTVLIEKVGRPIVQLCLVAIAGMTGRILLVTAAWALPYIPSACLSYPPLRRLLGNLSASGVPVAPTLPHPGRDLWRFSAPRALVGIFQQALQRLDIVLVFLLRGAVAAAIYTAATRFLVVGQMPGGAIIYAMQPQVSRLLSGGRREEAEDVYRTSTAWLIMITWPLYLAAALLARPFLGLFGHGYASASPVVVLLAAAMLVATSVGQVDIMLAMTGRSWVNLLDVTIGLGLNIGIDLILIPRMGILGAAIGWAVAILATNLIPLLQVLVLIRMHPFGRSTLAVMATGLACILAPGLIARLFGASTGMQAVVVGTGCVAYLAAIRAQARLLHLDGLAHLVRSIRRRGSGGADRRAARTAS
ncbi:MAG: lipopolysaccharide biosynthesis protein [Acidimicrobiales bacterium]